MRALTATAFVALTVSAFATPPVPRKSPEFTFVEPSGKQILLSSLKGKIVVMPFMFTTCPHCQRYAQDLTQLEKEFGPRGVVPWVRFLTIPTPPWRLNSSRNLMSASRSATPARDQVVSYLGLSVLDRWVVPQVAIIDRKGNIVAQSAATGSPELQEPGSLRTILDKIVKESGATGSVAPGAKAAPKTVAKSTTAPAKTN